MLTSSFDHLQSARRPMSVKHSEVFKFFSKILPNEELIYHSPLPPSRPYDPTSKAGSRFIASRLILSLTPSEAVYETLNRDPRSRSILFLHRPFRLDRRRVPVRQNFILKTLDVITYVADSEICLLLMILARYICTSISRQIR